MSSAVSWCLTMALFFLGSLPAHGQDFLKAKVLAVDSDKMEIEVLELASGRQSAADSQGDKLLIQIAQENDLPRIDGDAVFPCCVVPGKIIRLWGKIVPDRRNVFLATDIRGCRDGSCSDPTGVRSRLFRFRKHHRFNGTDVSGQKLEPDGFGGNGLGGNGHGGNGNGCGGGGGGR